MQLLLGSESPFRKQVLLDAGFQFEVMPSDIDEKAIRFESPKLLTVALAKAKADKIEQLLRESGKEACVITGDQVVLWNGKILEKPTSRKEAEDQLVAYRFSNPSTVTALHVRNMYNGKKSSAVEVVEISISPFSQEEMQIILDDELTYKCCGAIPFGIPGNPASDIVGRHQKVPEGKTSSVIGMPLDVLDHLLEQTGFVRA